MQSSGLVSNEKARSNVVRSIGIILLRPSRYQVRDDAFFNKQALENLASSLRSLGLLERPKVRVMPEDPRCFEIISGHRRIQAASEILRWDSIECEILEDVDEFAIFQLSLEDNIQRHNLSSYEEGVAFLLSEKMFGLSQDQIAERFHQSRSAVQTKRQLAISAGSFLKYTESSYSKAFLRNVTLGHIAILNRLDLEDLRHATRMISRGTSTRHLARFANLFGRSNLCDEKSSKFGHMEPAVNKKETLPRIKSRQTNQTSLLKKLDSLIDKSNLQANSKSEIRSILRQIIVAQDDASLKTYTNSLHCPKCGAVIDA